MQWWRIDWFPTFGTAVDRKQSHVLCENQFLGWVYEIFQDLLDCNFFNHIFSHQARELLGYVTLHSYSETFDPVGAADQLGVIGFSVLIDPKHYNHSKQSLSCSLVHSRTI